MKPKHWDELVWFLSRTHGSSNVREIVVYNHVHLQVKSQSGTWHLLTLRDARPDEVVRYSPQYSQLKGV